MTHDFTLPLVDRGDEEVKEGESTLHFTLCVTGMKVEEDDQHHEPQDSEVVAHKYVCVCVLVTVRHCKVSVYRDCCTHWT